MFHVFAAPVFSLLCGNQVADFVAKDTDVELVKTLSL